MNPKHQIYMQKCLCFAGSIGILCIGPVSRLSRFCHGACEPAFQGRISRTRKFVHMSSELSDTFLWPHGFDLAQLNDPHGFRAQHAIPAFFQRIQGTKNSSTAELGSSCLEISTMTPRSTQINMPSIFFSLSCSGLCR